MRLPNRKPGKYTFPTFDPHMTQEKFDTLKQKLEHIKTVTLPKAIKETSTYRENGDFSENAEYQIAKGRLRGLLRSVDELQHQITHAQIIPVQAKTGLVQIGSTVTIVSGTMKQRFHILGSTEADPMKGIISYQSPLGGALLNHAVGDTVKLEIGERKTDYQIVAID